MKKCKVYGVGVNDADYPAHQYAKVNNKYKIVWRCPLYRAWESMIKRCYSEKYHQTKPTYSGCSVCDEWLTFSNFKSWMEKQDWKDQELDKDLLVEGNKTYSPATCLFVDRKINTFVTDGGARRGEYMIGVSWKKDRNKFQSHCCNPFTGKREFLGYFTDELEGHLAWKARKHELSCQLADSDLVQDARLAHVLRTKYSPDTTQEVKAA